MDGYFSGLLRLLNNGKKPDSFAAHFEHHFNNTTPGIDLRKYTTFKAVKQLNPIFAMKTFTKTKRNLCMEERLPILQIYVKYVSCLWIRTGIYTGPTGTKRISIYFA